MTAYEIYASALYSLGYGYPLWVPESLDGCEVQEGAVGWLLDGGFRTLFNSMVPADHDLNSGLRVPPDHIPFYRDPRSGVRDHLITQPLLQSRNIQRIGVSASASLSG